MDILFTSSGQWITPHANHVIKSYYYTTDIQVAIVDANSKVIDSYPKASFMSILSRQFINKINHELAFLNRCKRNEKGTYTYVYEGILNFIVAPIYYKLQYKGFVIAGPLCLSREEWLLLQEKDALTCLKTITLIKEPPKIFYLSQTLQHLMDKAIYIGPHYSEPNKTFISKEDMKKRSHMNKPFLIMLSISEHVIQHQLQEALKLYKQSLMFGDFVQDETLHKLQHMKIQLISLLTLIYEKIIGGGFHSPYLEHYYDEFSNRIINSHSFQDLFDSGECIIKKFSQTITIDALKSKSPTISQALKYIHTNFDKKITLNDICQHIYISKTHLSSLFKTEMNTSVMNYLKSYRIQQSQYMLKHTNLSILDIALDSGFENANYFSNVFKAQVGTTPSKYRKEVKG